MENLDLDINNYSIKDIEAFFQLNPNIKYTASDIEAKEYQIREILLKSNHVNKRFKTNLIEFLTLAKNWLIFVKCPSPKQPTTIPKNYQLDPFDVPRSKPTISRTEELVNRPETQFIYTKDGEFLPGNMNPLNTRTISKCLNIDTRFRDNLYTTQSSDFTIQLSTKFNKVVSLELSAVEIPVTFFGIAASYGNNFLSIYVNYSTVDASGNVLSTTSEQEIFVIADGNYTSNDFIDVLNYTLSLRDNKNQFVDPTNVFSYIQFSVDFNELGAGSRRVSFGPTLSSIYLINEIILDFSKNIQGQPDSTDIYTKLGWNLGFIKPTYSGSSFYVSENMIEPNTKYIYLSVDDFNNSSNNQFISAFSQLNLNSSILARISLKDLLINTITENSSNIVTQPRHYFGPVDIQRLRIRLFDEFGRVLSMNNSNFSFCLTLKLLYDL